MTEELLPAPKSASAIAVTTSGAFMPTTFDEAWRVAQLFSRSQLVPRDYQNKPENCLVAMQFGAEIGLKPLQALQGIAVINGRPGVWGDAMWALVRGSRLVAGIEEKFDDATMTAICSIKRRDGEVVVGTFSKADAEKAKLWGKEGPWGTYPKRMLKMRARAFAARDAVPEVLKGLAILDEFVGLEPDPAPIEAGIVRPEDKPAPEPKAGAVEKLKDRILSVPRVSPVAADHGDPQVAAPLVPPLVIDPADLPTAGADVPEGPPSQLTGKEIES